MVGFGVRTSGVEVPGGVVVVVVVDGSVVVRLRSRAELSCADGAFDAASSSESSELKPARGISEMMGRDTGRVVDSGPEADFCFFFGCGSSVEVARCCSSFDRTGTGIVMRVVVRGRSGPVVVPGGKVVECPSLGAGFRGAVSEPGR
jgi:hypothetical protein